MTLGTLSANMRIFWMLLRRDCLILWRQLGGMFIDSGIVFVTQLLVFGKLFPAMGMPINLAAPLYLGAAISFMFYSGYAYALRIKYETEFSGIMDYLQTLPLPKRWLFGEQIIFFLIDASFITLPQIVLGILLLPQAFAQMMPNWPLFALFYIISLLFFSLFMNFLSYHYDFDYFTTSIWPRRLSPLFWFSVLFISSWKGAYSFSPVMGYILLLNPSTYFTEGMRSTLLGGTEYLAWWICLPVGIFLMLITTALLARAIKRRLDPV